MAERPHRPQQLVEAGGKFQLRICGQDLGRVHKSAHDFGDAVEGFLRRLHIEPPLAPSRPAHPWSGCVQAVVDAAVLHRWHAGPREADQRLLAFLLQAHKIEICGMVDD